MRLSTFVMSCFLPIAVLAGGCFQAIRVVQIKGGPKDTAVNEHVEERGVPVYFASGVAVTEYAVVIAYSEESPSCATEFLRKADALASDLQNEKLGVQASAFLSLDSPEPEASKKKEVGEAANDPSHLGDKPSAKAGKPPVDASQSCKFRPAAVSRRKEIRPNPHQRYSVQSEYFLGGEAAVSMKLSPNGTPTELTSSSKEGLTAAAATATGVVATAAGSLVAASISSATALAVAELTAASAAQLQAAQLEAAAKEAALDRALASAETEAKKNSPKSKAFLFDRAIVRQELAEWKEFQDARARLKAAQLAHDAETAKVISLPLVLRVLNWDSGQRDVELTPGQGEEKPKPEPKKLVDLTTADVGKIGQ